MRPAARMMMIARGRGREDRDRREPENRYEPENRRSRRTGRYLPRNEYQPEHRYEDRREEYREPENRYRTDGEGGRMIGFEGGRMHYGSGSETGRQEYGGAEGREGKALSQKEAVEWVNKMSAADGSRGAHFSMDETERIRQRKGWDHMKPVEFWVAMNAMWSDGVMTARRYGVDDPDYWADMAKDFLTDKDARPEKLKLYYENIVK